MSQETKTIGSNHPIKRVWTEEEDLVLRQHWPNVISRKTTSHQVARLLKLSVNQIRYRATQMGLVQAKKVERSWTIEEEEYLCQWAHLGISALQKRFKQRGWVRSHHALANRLSRLKQKTRGENTESYSIRGLADLLGISDNQVKRWIKNGWLPARPRTAGHHYHGSDSPAEWAIRPKDVRRFIMDYTAHVNLHLADKFWLVDLLTRGEKNDCAAHADGNG